MRMVTMIELPEMPRDSAKLVGEKLEELGLPTKAAIMIVPSSDGYCKHFALYATTEPVLDCKVIMDGDNLMGFFHGTDCNMTRRVVKDLRYGKKSKFQNCSKRESGGVFEAMELPLKADS